MNNTSVRALRAGALLLAAAFTLAGCSADEASAPGAPESASDAVTITDAWVKAADSGMTAAFGELHNSAGTDVVVTAVTSPASGMSELHETVEDDAGALIMREVAGGFVIPADGTLTLEPGGDHIMLMGLTAPLLAGEETSFTLSFADGSELLFTAPVKEYAGANENYADDEHHDHDDEHGDH